MPLNYPFLLRSVFWSGSSIYLWRTALFPRYGRPLGKADRVLRVVGALITLWLAVLAIGRGFGLFQYLF